MAARVKIDTQASTAKHRYQVRNWSEYDRALVNRGSLTVWFDEQSIDQGWTPPRPKALAHKLARACFHIQKERGPFDVTRCFA